MRGVHYSARKKLIRRLDKITYVLCVVLPAIHTCLNLISLRLGTGIVTASLLETPGKHGCELSSNINCCLIT